MNPSCCKKMVVTKYILKNDQERLRQFCEVHGWGMFERQSDYSDLNFELPFGKHKGKTIGWIWAHEPGYAQWIIQNTDSNVTKRFKETQAKHFSEQQ